MHLLTLLMNLLIKLPVEVVQRLSATSNLRLFLTMFKIFWTLSNFWPWSEVIWHTYLWVWSKTFGLVKIFWTWSKIFWTSRWIRQKYLNRLQHSCLFHLLVQKCLACVQCSIFLYKIKFYWWSSKVITYTRHYNPLLIWNRFFINC